MAAPREQSEPQTSLRAVASLVLGLGLLAFSLHIGAAPAVAAIDHSGGRIVVAKRAVAAGQPLVAADLTLASTDTRLAATYSSITAVVGRRLTAAIAAGAPVITPLLAPADEALNAHRLVGVAVDPRTGSPVAAGDAVEVVMAADGGRPPVVASGVVVDALAPNSDGSLPVVIDTTETGAVAIASLPIGATVRLIVVAPA